MYITPSSPKPERDTGYIAHTPGVMLEVGNGLQHQLMIVFLVVQPYRARCLTAFFLRNDLAYAAGVHVSTKT
jgi:hypothetical protein